MMKKMRVVSLSERLQNSHEASVGLELAPETRQVTVGEVFEALQQYLDQQRGELARRGPDSVRVSLVRTATRSWQATLQ